VKVLEAGTFTISFEGNGFGLGPVEEPSQALNYLLAVSDAFAVTGVAPAPTASVQTVGAQVNPTDGTLAVTISGSGFGAGASAKLVDGAGNTVQTTTALQISGSGSLLTATFPVTPAGLYILDVLNSSGTVIATSGTSPTVTAPPAIPLFTLVGADALPQLPGKAVTHFWRLTNTGTVDGVAVLSFAFPDFISPEPTTTSGYPDGSILLSHGLIAGVSGGDEWLENIAVPVPAGGAVDVPWTITVPPGAVFGTSPSISLGQTVVFATDIISSIPATLWNPLAQQLLAGEIDVVTLGSSAVSRATAALATAVGGLPGMPADQFTAYINALNAINPGLGTQVSALSVDVDSGLIAVVPDASPATVHASGTPYEPPVSQGNQLPPLPPGAPSGAYDAIGTAAAIYRDYYCGAPGSVSNDVALWVVGLAANQNPATAAFWFARNAAVFAGQKFEAAVVSDGFQQYENLRQQYLASNNLPPDTSLANNQDFKNFINDIAATNNTLNRAISYLATGDAIKNFFDLTPQQFQQGLAALEFAHFVNIAQQQINANKTYL
jgi:hypothetical protein